MQISVGLMQGDVHFELCACRRVMCRVMRWAMRKGYALRAQGLGARVMRKGYAQTYAPTRLHNRVFLEIRRDF